MICYLTGTGCLDTEQIADTAFSLRYYRGARRPLLMVPDKVRSASSN